MKQGWRKGLTIHVHISGRYRKGKLTGRKGSKWHFLPDGYSKTRTVCPFRSKWHYDHAMIAWPKKIKVLFLDNKPFRFRRERFGSWHGAKTGRTKPVSMRVWHIKGTSDVYVGHLGRYSLAICVSGRLQHFCRPPQEGERYFLGRGPLDPIKFKTLKTVEPLKRISFQRLPRVAPLFSVPTRDELG